MWKSLMQVSLQAWDLAVACLAGKGTEKSSPQSFCFGMGSIKHF